MAEVPDKNCFLMRKVISNLASQKKVGGRLAAEPTNLSLLWWLSIFGTQLLLLGVMVLSICDSWCSYYQDLKTIYSSFQSLFPKICCLAEFQFEMMFWILIFNFLRISLFWINEKVFLLGPGVFVFLVIICEVPFQMMKLLILDSWRLSTKISEFGCWISRHGETRWQELFLDGNKSYQIMPQEKLDVSLRQNQPISTFFDDSHTFWYAVAVARSDDFVRLWLLMFVPPRSENNLQLVSVSFPKNLLSRGIPVRNDVLDLDIQLLEDFFVLNQWKGLLAWTGSFRIFGDNLWAAVSNVEASNTRLVKTFHQDFLIWLLNLSSWRKSLTRTVFWWEKSYQTLLLKKKVGGRLAAEPTNLSLLWWLSIFGTQLLLLGVMVLSICDSWCSYYQDLKTIYSSFQSLFPKICCLAEFQFEMMFWILIFNFLRISLFWINEKVFLLGPGVFVFLVIICEVPFQMMKLLILDSWRLSTKISEFGCWISRHGETRWQELFLDGNKSYQIMPQEKLDVSLRQNQPISTFFDDSHTFWYAVAVARSDDFVRLWLLMFVPPRSENNLQLVSVSFPTNLLSRGIPVRNDVLDLDIQLLEDFFVLNQWKGLLAWTWSFCIFGDNLWGAVSNDEASNTRLLKTFHQDFWIWLLNLSPWRNSLTRTVFGWEQVISNHASRKVGCVLAAKPTNLNFLWWLSYFLVLSCCCSEWWFCPSVTPDVRTTKIWKQFAARFSFFSQKFAVSRNSSSKWCFGSWYSTSWGFLFWINEKVFLLGLGVFVFLEIICELPFQMLKLLILDSWRLSTKISEFGCWISRHGETRWQELFLDGNKSYQIMPQEKLDVSLRQNQPISAFFDGSQCFWYAVAVARSDGFVHLWLLMFVPPRSENNLQLVSVSFPKICCLAEFQFEMILWIVGFQLLENFFVLYQWSGLASRVPSFRSSLRWVS